MPAVADAPAITESADLPAAESFDPAAHEEQGFGDMLNQQREERETARLAKEEAAKEKPAAEAVKEDDKAATTPVGDVLDEALKAKGEPKKEEPVIDPLAEFKDVEKGTKSDNVRENIVKMRERIGTEITARTTAEKRAAALEKELATAKQSPELAKVVAEKDARITELTKGIQALDIRYDPDFQKEFVQGRKELVGKILDKAKAYGGDPDALQFALSMPEGKRRLQAIREALGEDQDAVAAVQSQIGRLDDLDERAAEKTKDAGQSWEQLQKTRAEQNALRQQQGEKAKDALFQSLPDKLAAQHPLLRRIESNAAGAVEHNQTFDNALAQARRVHSEGTLDETGPLAVKGYMYDHVEKLLTTERTERRALETRLREYEQSEPGLRGTKKPVTSSKEEDEGLGLGDLLAKRAAERDEAD